MRKMVPCDVEGCGHGSRHHILTLEGPLCEACLSYARAMASRRLKVQQEVEARATHHYVPPIMAGDLTADPPPLRPTRKHQNSPYPPADPS
jgi:hypothetical protein